MTRVGVLAIVAFTAVGCGGTSKFANRPRPPLPVNITVFIRDGRVSVSPTSVGAGPVVFQVANYATRSESIAITRPGGPSLASTGPINPQATAQVAIDLSSRGDYAVSATNGGSSNPAAGNGLAATVHVGAPRHGSRNTLLTP
jgi:hypothetical protein